MCSSNGVGAQNTAVASAVGSSTGVGVTIAADTDKKCSYTDAGSGSPLIAAYTSSGAGAGVM